MPIINLSDILIDPSIAIKAKVIDRNDPESIKRLEEVRDILANNQSKPDWNQLRKIKFDF